MREKLTELLAKVEGAAEGSRELDEAIHATLRADDPWWKAIAEGRRLVADGQGDVIITACNSNLRADSWAHSAKVASYSTSVDAALALAAKTMPGHGAGFQPGIGGRAHGYIVAITDVSAHFVQMTSAPTAPLAILGSLLLALLAQTETSDAR